ncbi:MAG: ribonuclease P protein component [Flavobacteriales bacterium]|jgi:ribonuclease P protein component
MLRYTFRKEERLTHRREIETLFTGAKAYKDYPFLLLVRSVPVADAPVKVVISVSKRRIRRAHDRNRVKRLIREAWRHEKGALYDVLSTHNRTLHAAWVFTGNTVVETPLTAQKIRALTRRLKEDIANLTLPETPSEQA